MLPDTTTTVKNDTTQVKKRLAVGTKVTYKKAVYKITRSTSKSAEVTLLYIKSKKVKKFTIPTKIKLSDGRKAKVTGIAKKAFNKRKKLKRIVIKSKYLKKKKIAKMLFMVYQRKQKSKCQRKNGKSIKDGLELRNFQKIKIYS
ncbi:MAG: hypothetical protein ACLVI9_14055 [Anaerostipes hadrus]